MSPSRRMTRRIEREEFERGHIGAGEEPVTPRPAAGIVLARSGPTGFEVLLLERPAGARFAPGAFVFPGGAVDEEDRALSLRERLPEGVAGEEAASLAAALRELFEETGYLLADRDPGPKARRAARAGLLSGEVRFGAIVEELQLEFRSLRACYLSRWITPARLAVRFDARFFLAELPAKAVQERLPALTAEHTDSLWIRPAAAVESFAAGELRLLFPTRRTLVELAAHDGLDELLSRCRGREVHPTEPRLLVREGEVIPVLPGDPRWEEAGP